MGRGLSLKTAIHYAAIRNLYKKRYIELGDVAKYVSKTYFVEYIAEKRNCSESSVRQILNCRKLKSSKDFDIPSE